MDKFARQSVQKFTPEPKFYRSKKPDFIKKNEDLDQQTLPRRKQTGLGNQNQNNISQAILQENKILDQAFLSKFSKSKAQIIQDWLEMSKEDIITQCQNYNIPISENKFKNVQSLFSFLNQFEQETLEKSQQNSEGQPQKNAVFDKFGKQKQEQIDAWLELNNTQLISECQKYGLSESTKHIQNIQTLFNYLKQIEAKNDSTENEISGTPITNIQSSDNAEIGKNFNKQFQRNREKPIFDLANQVKDAQIQLEKDFGKIFERQKNLETNLNSRNSFLRQNQELEPVKQQFGPVAELPWTKFTKDEFLSSIKARKSISDPQLSKLDIKVKQIQSDQTSNLFRSNEYELNQQEIELRQNKYAQILEFSQNQKIGELVSFAHQNFDLLEFSSRNLVLLEIKNHLNSITVPEFQNLFPQQKQINSLINLVQRFKNKLEQVPEIIFNPQIFKIEKNLKLQEQAQDVANSIAILNEMKPLSKEFFKQIQEQLNDGTFLNNSKDQSLIQNSKTGKKISDISLQNLMYLKPDKFILERVLAQDLNKMSTRKILFLTEKVFDQKNSLLKEQLMSQLSKVPGTRYSLEEANQLLQLILKRGWQADSEVTVVNLLQSRIMFSIPTTQELSKILDFCESISRVQPIVLSQCRTEFRDLMQSTLNLSKIENIPLQQMIRVATLLTPHIIKPTFLFNEILLSKDNFANDVSEESLEQFVKVIQNRLNQQKVTFDHLGSSHSIIHRLFVPYTNKTFQVLSLIISHKVNQNIANSILSDQFVTRKLFPNYDSAKSILLPMLQQINQKQVVVNQKQSNMQEIEPDLLKYRDLFLMLKNVCQTLPEAETQNLSKQIIEKAIMNLKGDIQKIQSVDLHNFITVNTAFLNAIEPLNDDMQLKLFDLYKNQLPLQSIMLETVRFQIHGANQKIAFLDDLKQYPIIKKAISSQTWQQTERMSGDFIKNFLYLIEKNSKTDVKQLFINEYLSRISNSRSLYSENLTNLIKLINKVQIAGVSQQHKLDILMMNICSNLKTIGIDLFNQPKAEENQQNQLFTELNRIEKEKDKELKQMILKMYLQLFQRNPALFQDKNQFSLSPLSNIMAELFDNFEHQNVLECIQLLGSNEINNYSEDFILKLYENYSQQVFMQKLFNQNPTFFFSFAKSWPKFLRNNSILNQLTKVKGKSVIKELSSPVQDQSETISILTGRNVLHPDLMDVHFETFIRLKDKETVAKYLNEFLNSAAYFGYVGSSKVEEITQVFRRIYKSPTECKIDQLLNYFVFLASSQTYYGDFDTKSILFIENALDIIEEQFTGTEYILQERFKDIKQIQTNSLQKDAVEGRSQSTVEEFKLSYFKQIQTQVKTYGKQAIRKQVNEIIDESQESQNINESTSTTSSDSDEEEEEITPVQEEIEIEMIGNEQIEGALELDPVTQTEMTSEKQEKNQQTQRRSYERKGSESQFQEDTEYLQFRNKKLTQLDKKGKHLLMYSNINQLNFVDINQINEAKAWAILFHFRAKSLQSMLFEEFNSISQRNAIGKTKSHQLFNKFYTKMMEESYNEGLLIQMANSCERTGWPIDISLHTRQSSNTNEDKNIQPQAIYFMLQEELCYNTRTKQEEPLGLQKLMVKHLQTISDYKVHFVTESEVQNNMEAVIEQLLVKMQPQKQQNAQQQVN